MKPIDPAKKYLIKGSTLKLLMSRKVTGADGEILTQRDAEGNVTISLANKGKVKIWTVFNGALVECEFSGKVVP